MNWYLCSLWKLWKINTNTNWKHIKEELSCSCGQEGTYIMTYLFKYLITYWSILNKCMESESTADTSDSASETVDLSGLIWPTLIPGDSWATFELWAAQQAGFWFCSRNQMGGCVASNEESSSRGQSVEVRNHRTQPASGWSLTDPTWSNLQWRTTRNRKKENI